MDKTTIFKFANFQKIEDNFDLLISKDITPLEKELLFEETPIQRKDNENNNKNFSHCFFPNDKPRNNYYHYQQKQKYNKPFQRGFYAQKPTYSIDHVNTFTINKDINYEKRKNVTCDIYNFIDAIKGSSLKVDMPIWYINNKNTKKDEGLFTSHEIVSMYNSKEIDGDTFIRPFDILVKKGTTNNKYVHLKAINKDNYIENNFQINHELINEISLLFSDKKDNINVKPEGKKEINNVKENNNHKFEKKDVKQINKNPVQKQNPVEEIKQKKENEIIITSKKEKEIKNNLNEEIINTNKPPTKTNNITTQPIGQGKHKKKRAKMVDIDVETGFYTLTQQEASYIPLYIVGDSKKK